MSLMNISVFWSFVSQYGQMIVTFVTSITLARLLSPAEIGIYSVSFALIGFATLFRDFGVSDYLVQEKELTPEKLQTAFTFNNLIAWTLGACVYLGADTVAGFYEREEISNVFKLLALNFIFVPMGAVTFAILRRNMNFKALANIQLVGILLTATTSIVAATLGQSYLSMAWGSIAGTISTAIMCQFYRPAELSIRPTLSGFKYVWAYSSFSILFTLVRYTSQSLSQILTGKFLGMADVGLLSKSRALPVMINSLLVGGLKPVLMPAFAKISKDRQLISQKYFKAVNLTLAIVWPAQLFLGYMSNDIVLLLFGVKWIAIAPLIKLTCVSSALWAAIIYADELFKATGNIRLIAKLEPLFLFLSAIAAIIGSQISITVLILLGISTMLVRIAIYLFLLDRVFDIELKMYLGILLKNLVSFIPLFFVLHLFSRLIVIHNPFLNILLHGVVFSSCWLCIVYFSKHQVYQFASSIFSRSP